jgi:hypothetical protein
VESSWANRQFGSLPSASASLDEAGMRTQSTRYSFSTSLHLQPRPPPFGTGNPHRDVPPHPLLYLPSGASGSSPVRTAWTTALSRTKLQSTD